MVFLKKRYLNRLRLILALLGFVGSLSFSGCGLKKGQIYLAPKAKNWASEHKLPAQEPEQVIYLVGDAGKYQGKPLPVIRNMAFEVSQHPAGKASVLFLGDNIYPKGLQDSVLHPQAYVQGLQALLAQMPVVQACKGKVVFIPGNHDWACDQKEGLANVRRQEQCLEQKSNGKIQFLPNHACPGPTVLKIDTGTVLMAIDTQWWLHPHNKPMTECGLNTENEWFNQVRDSLRKYAGKRLIVAGHHPFFSNGPHNKGFTIKQHLFPLTEFKKNAYLPLPVLGSIYVGWRSILGFRQDMPNARYQTMCKKLMQVFSEHPNLIYVSGHEHSLGYYPNQLQHYILSGAGSKSSAIVKGKKAFYAQQNDGFAKLIFYKESAFVEYYYCNEKSMRLAFRWRIR